MTVVEFDVDGKISLKIARKLTENYRFSLILHWFVNDCVDSFKICYGVHLNILVYQPYDINVLMISMSCQKSSKTVKQWTIFVVSELDKNGWTDLL